MADVIETKVQIADSRQEFNSTIGNYKNAIATLNNIIGLSTDISLDVTYILNYLPHEQSEIECLEYALAHRPDGIAVIYEIKRAEVQVNATKSDFRPSVAAIVQSSMTGEGASISRQNLEITRLEVHNAYTNLKIAEENIKISSEAVEQAKEKFFIAQVCYEEVEDTNFPIMEV